MKIRLKNIEEKSYYKVRIILIFSAVTILLVASLSRVGYLFIKDIYLHQLSEQANIVTKMIARQIEPAYLSLLEIGHPSGTSEKYFIDLLNRNLDKDLHSEIFIFDSEFNIVIHSNPDFIYGEKDSRLLLNKNEINNLEINSGASSLPFKGNDGNWYLWGFYRLSENRWLSVRESAVRFNSLDQLAGIFWIFGGAGVLITIIAAWFMANSITKPVNKLINFSSEIGKGNFSASPPSGMHGEIKFLSDAMDKMKKDLAENQREKEKMLAQIAHEIRNPLGGIELLANLAKENINDTGKNRGYLNNILKEVQGLKTLITSYLNYSRPVPANPVWVDLKKLFPEVEKIFRLKLKEKNINFNYNLETEKIWFDEGHLKQILLNLITNSLESINDYGDILITAKENLNNWEISLIDNGPGIGEKDAEKIFNPFYTTKKNGTGLGLSISKKLSKENKAELLVLNSAANGAEFILKKVKINES